MQQYNKMIQRSINVDDVTKENIKEHNPNQPQIPDHSNRIITIGCSGSGKMKSLFNLIKYQPDIDKIYLYANNPSEAKYQFSINKRQSTGLNHLNDSKVFIGYSNDMDIKMLKNTIQIQNIKY